MYYNKITNKRTTHRFRFKTAEEFISEYGRGWMSIVKYSWNSEGMMDYLFGIDVEHDITDDDLLDDDFYFNSENDTNNHNWVISKDMITENNINSFQSIYIKNRLVYE